MRPHNGQVPKPLVTVGGKALIDHVLDRLALAGATRAVVNVHYLADQIERHLAGRKTPEIVLSDERNELLGTAGGPVNAMPLLGGGPFFLINSDTIWIDGVTPNLNRLADAFDPTRMDALLLMAPTATAIGYAGRGDFSMAARRAAQTARRARRGAIRLCRRGDPHAGVLRRRGRRTIVDVAAVRSRGGDAGRLYGLRLEGVWMHVGSPDAIAAAEAALASAA